MTLAGGFKERQAILPFHWQERTPLRICQTRFFYSGCPWQKNDIYGFVLTLFVLLFFCHTYIVGYIVHGVCTMRYRYDCLLVLRFRSYIRFRIFISVNWNMYNGVFVEEKKTKQKELLEFYSLAWKHVRGSRKNSNEYSFHSLVYVYTLGIKSPLLYLLAILLGNTISPTQTNLEKHCQPPRLSWIGSKCFLFLFFLLPHWQKTRRLPQVLSEHCNRFILLILLLPHTEILYVLHPIIRFDCFSW